MTPLNVQEFLFSNYLHTFTQFQFKVLCFNDSSYITLGWPVVSTTVLCTVFHYAWLAERWGTSRHYLDCSCTFGHFSWIVVSTTSFFIEPVSLENFVFIHWRSLYKAGLWTVIFVPFGLETSDIRKPAKCVSPHREANKIIYVFVPLLYCLAI